MVGGVTGQEMITSGKWRGIVLVTFQLWGVKHQTKATDKRKCLFGLMVPGGQESVWAGKPGSQQQIWTEREAENSCPQTKAQRQEPTGSQVRLCTLKAPPVEGHAS